MDGLLAWFVTQVLVPSKNEIFFCILPLCMKPFASELSDSFSEEVFSVDLGADVGFLMALVVEPVPVDVEAVDDLGLAWPPVSALLVELSCSIGLLDFMELLRTSFGSAWEEATTAVALFAGLGSAWATFLGVVFGLSGGLLGVLQQMAQILMLGSFTKVQNSHSHS